MACHAPAGRLIHQRRSISLFPRSARPPPRSVLPILCRFEPEGTAPSLSRRIGKAPSASKVFGGPAGLVGLLALAVVDLFEVGVHHFLVAAGLAIAGAAARGAPMGASWAISGAAFAARLLRLIELLTDLHGDLRQSLGLGLDGGRIL